MGNFRKIPDKDFSIKWDTKMDSCMFRHKNGAEGEPGCGTSDSVSVYMADGKVFVLSVNYQARYACLESITKNGVDELVFADPKDINKLFGDEFSSRSPKYIAERLFKEFN